MTQAQRDPPRSEEDRETSEKAMKTGERFTHLKIKCKKCSKWFVVKRTYARINCYECIPKR